MPLNALEQIGIVLLDKSVKLRLTLDEVVVREAFQQRERRLKRARCLAARLLKRPQPCRVNMRVTDRVQGHRMCAWHGAQRADERSERSAHAVPLKIVQRALKGGDQLSARRKFRRRVLNDFQDIPRKSIQAREIGIKAQHGARLKVIALALIVFKRAAETCPAVQQKLMRLTVAQVQRQRHARMAHIGGRKRLAVSVDQRLRMHLEVIRCLAKRQVQQARLCSIPIGRQAQLKTHQEISLPSSPITVVAQRLPSQRLQRDSRERTPVWQLCIVRRRQAVLRQNKAALNRRHALTESLDDLCCAILHGLCFFQCCVLQTKRLIILRCKSVG
jgi:hypothetical protein